MEFRRYLECCDKNSLVDKVFKLILHDNDSWVGLYKIYEVINKDLKNNDYKLSISKSCLNRFTQTANSYKAVGLEARHAIDYEPPITQMNITEAKLLISLMVKDWLSSIK